jgi:hypothetical protein
MIRLGTGLAALSLSLVVPTAAAGQVKLGEVLLFTFPSPEPGVDPKAFELPLLALAAARDEPGIGVQLFRADRGNRKGQLALVWIVDTVSRRRARASRLEGLAKNVVEYQLVAPEAVGALPEVDVLGVHYVKVRPDRVESFDRFVSEKLHPAVGNLRPDLRILYYKAVAGADAGSYVALFALTTGSRDKYWPGGSDSDDLRRAFKPVQGLTKELSTFLVEGSYLADPKFAASVYESREWADFVLVSASAR